MRLDLECLESFLVLVQEGHYGRAANRLQIASPALSKRMQRLERQLKVRLLERGPAGVVGLTAEGARVAAEAEPLLAQERRVCRAAQGHVSVVTLGVPHDGGSQGVNRQALADVRRLLRLDHPDATLVCRFTPLPLMTTWLLDGQTDVQLTAGAIRHSRVSSAPVGSVARLAVVSARNGLAEADRLPLEQLVEQPILRNPDLPNEFMEPFWLGDVRPAEQAHLVSIPAGSSREVYEHVMRAAGVAVVLGAQAQAVPTGLRVLPLEGVPPLILHAARRADDRRPIVASVIRALHVASLVRD